jgi:hypothetical protein
VAKDMTPSILAVGVLLAQEENAGEHFGRFLGGLLCFGGIIGVVLFVKWALNPPRKKGK